MTRGYFRLVPGLRDSASMIGAKSVPALASTYSTPRSARRVRKDSAVIRAAVSVTEHFPRFGSRLRMLLMDCRPVLKPPYHAGTRLRLDKPSVGARPIIMR